MDIRDVLKTDKYAMCCRNAEEMLWLEEQLQQLGIPWVTRDRFKLEGGCWKNLEIHGDCSFACNDKLYDEDSGYHICMSYAYADYYRSLGDKPRVIIEVADLMPVVNYADLLDLL